MSLYRNPVVWSTNAKLFFYTVSEFFFRYTVLLIFKKALLEMKSPTRELHQYLSQL